MTNEEKQALIEYIETDLNCLRNITLRFAIECEKEDIKRSIQVNEIALAALTANPVAWLVEFQEPITDDYCRSVKSVELEKPEGHYLECATALFTRPAPAVSLAELVPILAPSEIVSVIEGAVSQPVYNEGVQKIWSACVDFILRNIEEAK